VKTQPPTAAGTCGNNAKPRETFHACHSVFNETTTATHYVENTSGPHVITRAKTVWKAVPKPPRSRSAKHPAEPAPQD